MDIFKRKKKEVQLAPALTKVEDPVNFNSVLDYMTGLSESDYGKLCSVTKIYRDANTEAAKVLGVEDKPTTAIVDATKSDEAVDDALDNALQGVDFIEQTPELAAKEQAPHHKIVVEQS